MNARTRNSQNLSAYIGGRYRPACPPLSPNGILLTSSHQPLRNIKEIEWGRAGRASRSKSF